MPNDEKRGPRYWWRNLDEEDDFLAMIREEGEHLRIEFHPHDRGKEWKLRDRRTGELCGEYNISHSCQPDCE